MNRSVVDREGMRSEWAERIRAKGRSRGHGFKVTRLGHVALHVANLERSVAFYTEVLGFEVSDVYPATMMPGGMVFLRFNADHHGIALVGGAESRATSAELHHVAFEVGSLDEVVRARDHLRACGAVITFEGRRRAGCQLAVEFEDPDGHALEIYWGLDQIGSDGQTRPPGEWRAAASLAEAIADAPTGQDTALGDPSLNP